MSENATVEMPETQDEAEVKEAQATQKPEKKARKKRTHYDVTNADVIQAWNKAESADEAAQKLGMPKNILQARVSTLRGEPYNIPLKMMERKATRKNDVEELRRLAEESLTPEQLEKIRARAAEKAAEAEAEAKAEAETQPEQETVTQTQE